MSPSPQAARGQCELITAEEVAETVDGEAAVLTEESGPSACAYEIRGGQANPYHLVLRLEDGFEDLATVKAVLEGGQDIGSVGDEAYWVPELTTLWLVARGQLHAVQLISFDDPVKALAIATDIGRLLAPRL